MATNGVRTFQAGAGLAAFAAFLSFVNFVYLQIWGFQSSGEVKPSKIRESPLELVEERIQSRDMDAPVYVSLALSSANSTLGWIRGVDLPVSKNRKPVPTDSHSLLAPMAGLPPFKTP